MNIYALRMYSSLNLECLTYIFNTIKYKMNATFRVQNIVFILYLIVKYSYVAYVIYIHRYCKIYSLCIQ